MRSGLTIGQAAAYADVTVKAVRHYHRLGLVDEAERDSSGYRRYGSRQLLQLVRVRTLARAGIPLAQIPAMLDAGPQRFAEAIDEIDRRLAQQIAELKDRRKTLHRLESGDRALLPDRACALLERLRELDFDADTVDTYRESLILARALFPSGFDTYLARFEEAIAEPAYVDVIKRIWDAGNWEPDDPRIVGLADAAADFLLNHPTLTSLPSDLEGSDGATRYGLINHHDGQEQPPTYERLTALIEKRLRAAGVDIPRQ
ncbi:MerR family DNA-binding transcriptional regulator [Stackebrandtia nassauensis]|uniref:Transcriptional regulator, MerR family n=1 Tax=Stackebrandtia nassauensis (strain DSM 44728 / CIP 108903 / NRRL B-16338 / NBRC 102104 / LLR-40K-21) TaxID=446470 RepID=D3Q1A3_STANL|nr:MerR family DNA-binding transcriptional regulator [Stackebrandtia nassauensis]ADD45683.1 transcriptional regulator, MerR family [Stackebrandtia nassauensis DSM 44728]